MVNPRLFVVYPGQGKRKGQTFFSGSLHIGSHTVFFYTKWQLIIISLQRNFSCRTVS